MLIRLFQSDFPTCLLTDASRLKGLGNCLLQIGIEDDFIALIQCGSRSLIPAKSCYTTIELECLAVYHTIKDCSFYLLGKDFKVVSDYEPLVGIFDKPLSDIENVRLLCFREKLMHFSFKVKYEEGKTHLIAVALSGTHVFD